MESMVTLHHFSHPTWFEDKGGFANAENVDYWIRFSEKMYSELGDRVKWWCTINEPAVFTSMDMSWASSHQVNVHSRLEL